jgi:hypothetical protein
MGTYCFAAALDRRIFRERRNRRIRTQDTRATALAGTGAPEEIRTPDPQIRSLVLYPAELRALRPPYR